MNKWEGKYTSRPALLPFGEWLLYFGECMEVSAHVDQIAHYARDRRVSSTDGFNAIILDKIGIKGDLALAKGAKLKGSMEELMHSIVDKHVHAFNKRYPRNPIVGQVFPDKTWFAKHGSLLFSNSRYGVL
jgi:hypothetical protein